MLAPPRARALPSLAAAALVAAALASCRTAPTKEDWIAVGFRSPRQAFHTFQTALAADAPALEYRCLTSQFRRGASQLAYREVREQLLREQPYLRRVADAKIVSEQRVSSDRVRLRARIDTLFVDVDFEVELAASGFAEVWGEEQLLWDEARSAAPLAGAFGAPPQPTAARIQLDPGAQFDPRAATELRVGTEWRIDAIRALESD
ncbi:MAG: hypothetical protein EPO68_10455 [Planctomycetota bacterium]|nr:MAG: hypothetical protein EPO68_10455 [Planctomycetota bacterium]